MPEGPQGQQFVVNMRTQAVLGECKMETTMKSVTLLMDNSKATGELYEQSKAFYWKLDKNTKQNDPLESTPKLSNIFMPVTFSL